MLPDRKTVKKGFAREVDWEARAKRRHQEELGIEDDQQPQVGSLSELGAAGASYEVFFVSCGKNSTGYCCPPWDLSSLVGDGVPVEGYRDPPAINRVSYAGRSVVEYTQVAYFLVLPVSPRQSIGVHAFAAGH